MATETKGFQPHTKAPYTRTDLQHYLKQVVTEKIDALKMPHDKEHDRRFLRALGAIAAEYMMGEGCKDPKYVATNILAGLQSTYADVLAAQAKEEFKAKGQALPSYLKPIDGGLGTEEGEVDDEGEDADEGEEDPE